MDETQKKMIEDYIQSYNAFDIEGMIENLHESVVFENISNGKIDLSTQGIAEFKKQAELAKGYFSQREQKITSWELNGKRIKITIDYKGVLAIELPNGMKPGDALQLKGQSIFEFKDGRIIKIQDIS